MVVGLQIGEEGKTAEPGRWTGLRGVRGGEGEWDWRRIEGRKRLSRRRRGGVNGGRVVVDEEIRGVVGECGGGKGYLILPLGFDGRVESWRCCRRRRRRNRARHAIRRRPRAELRAMATLVPVASSVSEGFAAVGWLDEFEPVWAAIGTPLLLDVAIVGALPLCVAKIVFCWVDVCAAPPSGVSANEVCSGR